MAVLLLLLLLLLLVVVVVVVAVAAVAVLSDSRPLSDCSTATPNRSLATAKVQAHLIRYYNTRSLASWPVSFQFAIAKFNFSTIIGICSTTYRRVEARTM